MRILILGSTGFIGKHLLRYLWHHQLLLLREPEEEQIKDFKPEVIYNLAGEIYDDDSMFDANVKLVYDLLMYTKDINYQKMIQIGSSSEYGRKKNPIKTIDYLNPETWYEGTKSAGTLLCQSFARHYKKPIAIARPFSLYGSKDNEKKLVPTLIRKAKTDKQIKISPGMHDYVYIDDFIEGIINLNNFKYGEVVNFGSGIQYSNEDIAKTIEKIMNIKFDIEYIEQTKSYDSMHWVCDTSENTYWQAKTSLEAGLRKTIEEL